MNMRVYAIAALCTIAGATAAMAQKSSHVAALEPYTAPSNQAAAPETYSYLPDGTALRLSPDGRSIVKHDIRTGKDGDMLLDLGHTRETTIADMDGYTISPNGEQILLWRESRPIYRRSFEAVSYTHLTLPTIA